jgi:hypothetical protein
MGDVVGWLFFLGFMYLVFVFPEILAYIIVIAFLVWLLCIAPWLMFVFAFVWAICYLAKD